MQRAACWVLYATIPVAIFLEVTRGDRVYWYESIQLLAVYAIIAVAMYFLPQR